MTTTTLLHTEGHVLAAIDPSVYAESVARHAGWAASRLGASLELLHAIDKPDAAASRDLSGNLASRYGGPATSLLHIAFEPGPLEGSTILKLTDSLFGRLGPGMAASVGSGWQSIFGDGLKRHVEEQG